MKKLTKTLLVLGLLPLVGCSGNSNPSTSVDSSPSSVISEEVSSSEKEASSSSSESVKPSSSEQVIDATTLYVSPEAKAYDGGKGTLESPMHLTDAIRASKKGTTILLMDGTYEFSSPIMISSDTEKETPTCEAEAKTLRAINPLQVKFDFAGQGYGSSNRGITVNSSYWHVYGIEVYKAGDNGIYIGGNHNVIENCITHDCNDTGIQLGRSSSRYNSIEDWPSYNTIKNCTSYDNHDPSGEDSDGFACKLTTGVGNVFDGCIAYNNVDDGWDLYTKGDSGPIGPVTLRNCVAFNNGVTTGQNTNGVPYGTSNSDGNGFKLGGEVIAVQHEVYNCVAFNNLATGFTDNSNPGTIRIENCTSFNNGARDADASNIDMCRNEDTSNNYYKNIFSYSTTGYAFNKDAVVSFNSKDQYKGTAVDSLFYYGRTMLKFEGVNECNYKDENLRGKMVNEMYAPFVSTTVPDRFSNIHEVLRDENYNVSLGDFLKVNPEFVTYVFDDASIKLGADLA